MDDCCHYCSGMGSVPTFTDGRREVCPKCGGGGKMLGIVEIVPSSTLAEALANLRRIQGDAMPLSAAMETFTVPHTATPSGPNRQQKRRMARGKP